MNERSRVPELLIGLLALAVVIAIAVPLTALVVMKGLRDLQRTDDTIVVTGQATRTLEAAAASWTVTVAVHERTPAAAAQALRGKVRAVDKYLADAGVTAHVRPRRPAVAQVRDVVRAGKKVRRVPAWEVRQQLDVTAADAGALDDATANAAQLLLNGTVSAVGDVTYAAPDAGAAELPTLRLAAADARRNAAAILGIVGGRVGDVKEIKLDGYRITPVAVGPGQKNVTALVSVTFGVER